MKNLFDRKYAFIWTAFSMGGKATIAFLQLIVLSRVLSVPELSLVALALTVTNTSQMISDLGVSSAIIHYDNISKNELSSLYWLNIFVSLVLTFVLLALSIPIANFYHTPRLQYLVQIVSLYFVFWAAGQQHRVLSEKRLAFGPLALIEVGAYLVGFLATLLCVHYKLGAASVVIGFVITGLVNSLLSIVFLASSSFPELHFKIADVTKYVRYGIKIVGANICNTLTLQSDVILAGRLINPLTLAVYSQPRELCLRIMFVINPIITRVTFPLMAAVKDDIAKVREIYLKSIRITASINFPIYLFIAAFSGDIVRLVFGNKWSESVAIMGLLGLWCAVRSLGNPVGSLLFATGRTTLALRNSFGVMISLFVLCAIGALWGYPGLIWTLIGAYVVMVPVFWWTLVRPACEATFSEYVWHFLPSGIAAAVAVVCARLVANVSGLSGVKELLLAAVIVAPVYALLTFMFNKAAYRDALEIASIRSA